MNGAAHLRLALQVHYTFSSDTNRRGDAGRLGEGCVAQVHHRQPVDLPHNFALRIDVEDLLVDRLANVFFDQVHPLLALSNAALHVSRRHM